MTQVWNKVTTSIQLILGFLLKEDGYYLLTEDGGRIIIEPVLPGEIWNKVK